jgi:hypothetical protein
MRIAILLAMSLFVVMLVGSPAAGQTVGERMWTPPATGNFFPLSDTNLPPIPFCPNFPIYYLGILPGMNGPCYGYDDSSLARGRYTLEDSDPPPIPGGDDDNGPDPGVPTATFPSYGTNDVWIDLTGITNDLVSLTLHNTHSNLYCQLLTNTDLGFAYQLGP